MSRSILFQTVLALALCAAPAFAQMLYKSVMPDGKVIYGDKPVPGAVKVEATKPDTSKRGITPSTPAQAEVARSLEAARQERESAGSEVVAAENALRQAEAALERGKEPLEGERIGTVAKGGSRFTDSYWERQKALEDAVARARADLEKARSGK